MDGKIVSRLILEARMAAANAYCPYSEYAVGAALLASDGTIWRGCNVENASYSVTCCAERTALFAAVATGHRAFDALAVVAGPDGGPPASPCGVCRQALAEFCSSDMPVYCASLSGENLKETTIGAMLPDSFSRSTMSRS